MFSYAACRELGWNSVALLMVLCSTEYGTAQVIKPHPEVESAVAKASAGPAQSLYLLKRHITYYGSDGSDSTVLMRREETGACRLMGEGDTRRVRIAFQSEVLQDDLFGSAPEPIVLSRSAQLDDDGRIDYEHWGPPLPVLGMEEFFTPSRARMHRGASRMNGVAHWSFNKSAGRKLDARWAWTARITETQLVVAGPFSAGTTGKEFQFSGYLERFLDQDTRRVEQSSGDSLLRIEPATLLLAMAGVMPGEREQMILEEYEAVVVHYSFQLIRSDLPESRSITVPDEVWERLQDED